VLLMDRDDARDRACNLVHAHEQLVIGCTLDIKLGAQARLDWAHVAVRACKVKDVDAHGHEDQPVGPPASHKTYSPRRHGLYA
jgi:hypothetical protein